MADDREFPIVPCAICLLLGFAFGGGVVVLSDSSQTVIDGLQAELRAATNHATELQAANEEAADLRSQLRLATATAKWAEDERDAAAALQDEAEKKLGEAMDGNTLAVEVERLRTENRNLNNAVIALKNNAEWAKLRITQLLKGSKTIQRLRNKRRATSTARGFEFSNVSFKPDGTVIGEVTNTNDVPYKAVSFNLNIYSASGRLLDVGTVNIMDIRPNETKSFDGFTENGLPANGRYEFEVSARF